ncbi:MAG: biotin transporter BioY [Clostridia bacterium]|nr:biotin transporter BioY [Clostridia bacterium]
MKTRDLTVIAIMAAILCIAAPLSVPIGPIPISLATFAVYLAGALLGWKRGTAAVLIYILLGAVGLPVFSGFEGGVHKLIGVTGGYIVGYLPCAAIVGLAADRWGESRKWIIPVAMVVGTVVLYAIGTAWFMIQMNRSLAAALGTCVLPFLPGDAVKIVVAALLSFLLRDRLKSLLNA